MAVRWTSTTTRRATGKELFVRLRIVLEAVCHWPWLRGVSLSERRHPQCTLRPALAGQDPPGCPQHRAGLSMWEYAIAAATNRSPPVPPNLGDPRQSDIGNASARSGVGGLQSAVWTKMISGKPVILVVEDEILVRMMAVMVAEKSGLEALSAATADEAIKILESRSDIRLVFTDVNIPGSMNGLRLAHAVRDRPLSSFSSPPLSAMSLPRICPSVGVFCPSLMISLPYRRLSSRW
jgi:hypothetical protein